MILKLDMEHLGLKFSKVYINDYACLTLTYFKPRSDLFSYAFKWGKAVTQSFIAANNKIDRKFMFLKNVDPRGWSAPVPQLYRCI